MINKTAITVIIHSDFLHKTVHMTSADLLSFFLISSCYDIIFALTLLWQIKRSRLDLMIHIFQSLSHSHGSSLKPLQRFNLLNCSTQPALNPTGDKACSCLITSLLMCKYCITPTPEHNPVILMAQHGCDALSRCTELMESHLLCDILRFSSLQDCICCVNTFSWF